MTALANETNLKFTLGNQWVTSPDDFLAPDNLAVSKLIPISQSLARQQLPTTAVGAPATAAGQEPQLPNDPQRTADAVVRSQTNEYRRFRTLQQWEGVVTEIRNDVFEAELRDLNHPLNPPEFVEMSLDEVSLPDKVLLRTGSIFYWIIGYETRTGGQVLNVSEVRFKRTPRWSRAELVSARKQGKLLSEWFGANGEISKSKPASREK